METPGASLLAQILRERITPVVMVLPTPAVEASCRKNHLRFLDLLRPFCTTEQIDVPVRTASDQSYRLQEFRLRMFYASEISQPKAETAEEYLLQFVSDSSDDALVELHGDPQNVDVIKQMAQSESLSSWIQQYIKEFMRSLAFSDHESIDHPVACLLVVSSRDENPVNKFVDLFNTDKLPALLNDGAMDPKLFKHYVLLHDNQDGLPNRANEIFSEMTGTFGPTDCRLLCINSHTHQSDDIIEQDFWTSHMVPNMTPDSTEDTNVHANASLREQKLGCLLNETDLKEISEFMLDFSSKQIIPYMEQKIRSLNQQVAATKKGLRNQIKNLWWRKGKEETSDVNNGPMYTFSSTESQIRLLADYAFMLYDYELALSNYRLLSSDYKTDKSWKHYAGVQEMIGLSLFMLDQSRKEAEYCMETAYTSYQKLGHCGRRFATRCALLWAEMHKARGQYKEAAGVYSRAAAEEPSSCAAILLEQAAYCYLLATPPMLRKYGFHLVLAGTRYNVCGQKKHAIRVFMGVLTVYEDQDWSYINDHVHFHLGRLSTFLGKFNDAVKHFMRLLACSHEPASMQATFLREFLYVVQNQDSKQESLKLDIPIIDMDTLRVHFEDQRTYVSAAAATLPEDMWLPLEAGLVPSIPSVVSNWLDAGPRNQPTSECTQNFNACVAGEELIVDVEFRNPLQIPVNISAVSLVCKFVSKNTKEKLGDIETDAASYHSSSFRAGSDNGLGRDAMNGKSNETQPSLLRLSEEAFNLSEKAFNLSEEAFNLKAGDKVVVHLKVTPFNQGILVIVGVKWVLSGIVKGYRDFIIQHVKRKLTGRSKSHQEFLPHQCLTFHVLKHMPRLEVSLHGMPGKVNAGELHRLVLELSNVSAITIRRIKFNTSHSDVLRVGNPADLDAEFPGCLEARGCNNTPLECNVENYQHGAKESIFIFPENIILEAGSTLLWPLWLHAREAGTLLLNNVLYYEVDKTLTDLQYRTVRMTHSLQVLPSLQISVHISPCLLHLKRYMLRLDIANQHNSESFWLRQVSCAGNNWLIAPLLPPVVNSGTFIGETVEDEQTCANAAFLSASVCPSQLLPAGQTLSLFFQLLNFQAGNSHDRDLVSSEPLIEFSRNVRLGPPSSSEPLIDIANTPLSEFHMKERVFQKQVFPAAQEKVVSKQLPGGSFMQLGAEEGMVDIILISEQQDETTADKPMALRDSQRLATHHICDCSVQDSMPLLWVMEGPNTIVHNFTSDPFCEITFCLTVKNCSCHIASVMVETVSSASPISATSSVSMPAQSYVAGWYDLFADSNSGGATASNSELQNLEKHKTSKNEELRSEVITPCASFIWCSLTCNRITELNGGALKSMPLRVAVFAPGIYDLSGYKVSWQLLPNHSDFSMAKIDEESLVTSVTRSKSSLSLFPEQATKDSLDIIDNKETYSGFGPGHPFLLTVLQSNLQ